MISMRMKDFFPYQQSVGRMASKERDIDVSDRFCAVYERLQDELREFNALVEMAKRELGLDKPLPKDATEREKNKYEKAQEKYKDEYEVLLQQSIEFEHEPIPMSELPGFQISTLDLVVLQRIGIIARGR